MNDDEKPPMPPQPTTKQIPAVQVPANTLDAVLLEVRAMRSEAQDSKKELKADIQLVATELNVVKGSVQNLQEWRGIVDEKLKANSVRVRGTSENDLQQDAAISKVIVQQNELGAKVDALAARPDTAAIVLDEVRAFAKTPVAQRIAAAIIPVLMLAISFIGIKLQMQVSKLEAKPDTVQPAPTVYIQVSPDGGKTQ